MTFTDSSPADAAARPPRRRARRLAFAAAATLAAALLIPSGVTGAYWTASAPGGAGTAGIGDWCATPDPSSNPRAIRIADIPTVSGTSVNMIAIPVANNASWGGGDVNRTLAVKLQTCSTSIPSTFSLRVTAWSNPASGAGATTWMNPANTGIAPSSRLNLAAGRGSEIQALAAAATVNSVDARRFSWLLSGTRTSSSPAANQNSCQGASCIVNAAAVTGSSAFIANNWSAVLPSVTYQATTYARSTLSYPGAGWANADRLNIPGQGPPNNSPAQPIATTMVPVPANASAATTMASSDGNLMQWVVIQWSGTTPPSDLIAEIVLL